MFLDFVTNQWQHNLITCTTVDNCFDFNREQQEVHVVVDPQLSKVLRPHQREVVHKLFNCLTVVDVQYILKFSVNSKVYVW